MRTDRFIFKQMVIVNTKFSIKGENYVRLAR